jgi:hypothetical protein
MQWLLAVIATPSLEQARSHVDLREAAGGADLGRGHGEVLQQHPEHQALVQRPPLMREGEIDFVASKNLTGNPFETWTLLRRSVRVETAVEIIAKKRWHRGDRLSARDLFDLSLVIEHEPEALRAAARFLVKHRAALLHQLDERAAVLQAQFEAIDVLRYKQRFEVAATRAATFLVSLSEPQ